MMQSALLIRSSGMLSGISMTSLMTIPQFSRRSTSFLSPEARSGSATSNNAIWVEIMRLITVHLVVDFWARAIIECPQAGRNRGPWKRACYRGKFPKLDAAAAEGVAFRLYFCGTAEAREKN